MAQLVVTSVKRGVATITLNSPATRNAMTQELAVALTEEIRKADNNADIRVIIITGAGKSFSVGASLHAVSRKPNAVGRASYDVLMGPFGDVILSVVRAGKPVIAAVNGAAAGASASLALACDFRVFATDGVLVPAFINIALAPDAGVSYFLPRLIGYSKALELYVEGKPINAERCQALGLANKVAPPGRLLEAAQEWAESIAERGAFALMATKRVMQSGAVSSLTEAIHYEAVWQQYCAGSADNSAGVLAFFEKKAPKFAGPMPDVPRGMLQSRL